MILDIETKGGGLSISHFNKEGNVEFIQIPLTKEERFAWEECKEDDPKRDLEFKTWNGRHVKKASIEYTHGKINKHRLNKFRINEILATREAQAAPLKEFNLPKKYFIDIEVEVLDGFPTAELAQNRVTAIGICSASTKKILVLGLKELSEKDEIKIEQDINKHFEKFKDKWSFEYRLFDNEIDMLKTFFEKLMPMFPCVTGWNLIEYDWRLNSISAINREGIKKINVEACSPSGKLMGKNLLPQHRLIVDYLEIYKKWDRIIKVRENNKLDYVGMAAVGIQKVKYAGDFKDLYEKDFYKFIFYNAVDCALVHYIDQKLNTMLAFLKLAHISGVEINKAFSPIWIMEAVMCREFLKENKIFIQADEKDAVQVAFEGAYVKDPVKGLHAWVTCYDFASLYPNTMMQYNISPETFIGNNIEPKEGQIIVGEHMNGNGKTTWRVFDNKEDSVLRKILVDFYGQRKATKAKYLQCNKEIDALSKYLN